MVEFPGQGMCEESHTAPNGKLTKRGAYSFFDEEDHPETRFLDCISRMFNPPLVFTKK